MNVRARHRAVHRLALLATRALGIFVMGVSTSVAVLTGAGAPSAHADAPARASIPNAYNTAIPAAAARRVTVIDASTRAPLAGATLTIGDRAFAADARGAVVLPTDVARAANPRVGVRAAGYRRAFVSAQALARTPTIALQPFEARGLYLTVYGIGHRGLREGAFTAIEQSHLNTIVIDMKGDSGIVPYASNVATASAIGATKVRTVKDLPALLADLKRRGLYTIARIVVFKDTLHANAHPEWAVRDAKGALWLDREGLAWIDPTRTEAWQYPLAIAAEAAAAGFDEIQFDYIRFPDTRGLRFSRPLDEATRVNTITGFLRAARTQLTRFNVYLSADVFGYVCWNTNDTSIGQQLEALAPLVDYLSPMLYASSFQYGIPGVRAPLDDPHAIVLRSLQRAAARTANTRVRYRPWIQDFRDYAFDGRVMTRAFLQAQIRAANESPATDGWLLWNPRNHYSPEAIHVDDPDEAP